MAAAESIGNKGGVILRNHGSVACGRDLEEETLSVEVIEKACAVFLDIHSRTIKEIPAQFIESERERFLYKYGYENT